MTKLQNSDFQIGSVQPIYLQPSEKHYWNVKHYWFTKYSYMILCNSSREFLSRIFNNQNEYDWLSVLQLHCVSTFNVIIWIKAFSFSHRPPNLYLSEHFHSQYLEILCSVQIWEPTPVYLRLNLQSADVTTTSALFYVLLSEDFLYIVLFGFPHFFSQSFSFFNFTNYFTWIALNKSIFFKSWS